MDPEIRIVRIAEALGRYGSGALSCLEAAEVLGMSERHFRRLRDRYEAEGAAGLVDRRLGRASGRRAPLDQIEWVLEQYRTRYWDFTAKHFHEHLVRDHGFRLSYCQKLCMGLSCGGAILAFSIHEFDASNDLGELI